MDESIAQTSTKRAESREARDRTVAQHRVDRIHAFQAELAQLQGEGLLALSVEQHQRLTDHHTQLMRTFEEQFDVDTTAGQKQLSLGLRIVSFLGALAFAASVLFFFYRIWGLISTPVQLVILIGAPLVAVVGMEWTKRQEQSPYFTSLIGLVAFAACVINLNLFGSIFNITPSHNAFLVWGAFALLLAYSYDLKLLLVAGMICVLTYLSATMGTWRGLYWLSFGERPENFIPAGFMLFFIPAVIPHQHYRDFPRYYRLFGMLTVLLAVLILSHWGEGSYLRIAAHHIETGYQLLGFVLAGLSMWIGIRWGWPALTHLGSTFFVIDLYTKFYDWWWEWMPKYLFFLTLGLMAILLMVIFKRLRAQLTKDALA
ncbi:MAG: DUF2157 domain-containing protein [Nitrospira sp.]|nr:DUF2157 domain-containing protein [Nitrospira sp.]